MDPDEKRAARVSTAIRRSVEQKLLMEADRKDITFGSMINEILEDWAARQSAA
jgi:hypothetical protein